MKKLFFSIFYLVLGTSLFAQSFEGVIEFKKQTVTDTSNYIYYIKGDKVRIDEIGKSQKIQGSFIVDLKANTMLTLHPDRKLYFEQAHSVPATITGKAEVKITGNVKTLHEYKCTEFIVKNADEKIQISYWVASGNFDFFLKLLKILNRKDKSSIFYQQLTGVEGMFPFLSTQMNLETGKDEVKMEVTKVQKKTVDANQFVVPKDYQKFQK